MTPYVLDTPVASFLIDKRPELTAYEYYLDHAGSLYISFQTVAELKFGALKRNWSEQRQQKLTRFLSGVHVVGYTEALAEKWAVVMLEARQAGRRLEAGDAWVAATALLLDIPLLTHDGDFEVEACPSITVYRASSTTS